MPAINLKPLENKVHKNMKDFEENQNRKIKQKESFVKYKKAMKRKLQKELKNKLKKEKFNPEVIKKRENKKLKKKNIEFQKKKLEMDFKKMQKNHLKEYGVKKPNNRYLKSRTKKKT